MPVPALDLSLDPPDEEFIRQVWARLAEVGAGSEAARTASSHSPHLTLAESPSLNDADAGDIGDDQDALCRLLPRRMPVGAVVVMGGRRPTVAYLLRPDQDVRRLVQSVRSHADESRLWLPHVTLARRIPQDLVPAAVVVAARHRPAALTTASLRLWDPATGVLTERRP